MPVVPQQSIAYEYDRDRMAFLEKKFVELMPGLRGEITAFIEALDKMAAQEPAH